MHNNDYKGNNIERKDREETQIFSVNKDKLEDITTVKLMKSVVKKIPKLQGKETKKSWKQPTYLLRIKITNYSSNINEDTEKMKIIFKINVVKKKRRAMKAISPK